MADTKNLNMPTIPIRAYLYGGALAGILLGVWFYGHTRYEAGRAVEHAARLEDQRVAFDRLVAAQEAARKAARQAADKAIADAVAGRKQAEKASKSWQQKYSEALQQPACSAWQAAAVRCPVPST